MRQVILVALVLKDTFQDNRETDFATQVKDELVCVNRVSSIEGKLKLAHLRIIIILIQYLQPALRHKITFRRISGSVPERLLPPKSEMTLDGCHRIITVPVSEFGFGKRNGGRLRKYLEELQHCHIFVPLKGESISRPLIAGFDYPQFSRTVDIHISEFVVQTLLTTEDGYFTFSKSLALSISNRYTLRIYWLICSWKQKGGFAITADRFRRQFGLGRAYGRIDNLTLKIIQPACQEMKDRFPVFFEYRLYNAASQYVVFKVKTKKTKTELQADFLMARDTTFNLLASVGASTSLLSEIFSELDHEDLVPYLRKLSEITAYVHAQKGRAIQDINAYILASITSWHTNWLSRYTLAE